MKFEYVPKGYNTWYEYNRARERREKWMGRLAAVLFVICIIALYCAVGILEYEEVL